MRSRRPFRPRFPRPGGIFGTPLPNTQVPPLLLRANQLFERGEYEDAAHLYEELGSRAEARKSPRTGHLYIRGARAYMLLGNIDASLPLLKKGFKLLAEGHRGHELQRISRRVDEELRQQNYGDIADELQSWLKDSLGVLVGEMPLRSSNSIVKNEKKAHLPLTCSSCGASVHPDEVEWVDEVTAECNFCGNLMRGEGE